MTTMKTALSVLIVSTLVNCANKDTGPARVCGRTVERDATKLVCRAEYLFQEDHNWSELDKLTNLRVLDLAELPGRPTTLHRIAQIKSLKVLRVQLGAQDTDWTGTLIYLKQLPDLRHLYLTGISLPKKDLALLGTFTQLRTLGLWWTATDEALVEVAKLKSLEELEIWRSLVTDSGLRHLLRLPKLEKLYIGRNIYLTQASVSTLAKMKTLREITFSGLDGLAQALPKCRINKVLENNDTLPPLTEYPLGK